MYTHAVELSSGEEQWTVFTLPPEPIYANVQYDQEI
jgi:hypothetical protein